MVYGDPEDPRVTVLIDNVRFHKNEYTKTKTPLYWDGEVYVPKDTEPVQVGNFTVEAEYLPIDTVYPTFNNGYSKVAKSGGWYYVLTDGDVSEYSDEDGGLAYEGDVYFDFDVEKCKEYIKHRNPNAKIFLICAKTGEGIEEWATWLNDEVREWIDK